jgi:hypothetical protein
MTDIEQKALALVNEVSDERAIPRWTTFYRGENGFVEALCRAIEAHEAFKQEVSDAVEQADLLDIYGKAGAYLILQRFIIPKPKPDPLVEAIGEAMQEHEVYSKYELTDSLRAALEARGLEIREKSK